MKTHPFFIYIKEEAILNLIDINKHSNSMSKAGINRPIVIMSYDHKKSMIYLGDNHYTI